MKNKKAFTMAEAIITLVILGVIFAIIVPSVYRNHTENVHRTKLKKAIEVYSNAIVTMSSENNFNGSVAKMDNWGKDNNCANIRQYFKVVQGDNSCQFKTSDGVWWDFGVNGTLSKAIVAFKEGDLDATKADKTDDYNAFHLVVQFDSKQKARIIDPGYGTDNTLNGYKAKVYAFIYKKDNNDNTNTNIEEDTSNKTISDENISVQHVETKYECDTSVNNSNCINLCKEQGVDICKIDGINYYKFSFVQNEAEGYKVESVGETYVGLLPNMVHLEDTVDICPPGTHFITALEADQFYNGARSIIDKMFEENSSNIERLGFWTKDECGDTSSLRYHPESGLICFSSGSNYKTSDPEYYSNNYKYNILCVGNI